MLVRTLIFIGFYLGVVSKALTPAFAGNHNSNGNGNSGSNGLTFEVELPENLSENLTDVALSNTSFTTSDVNSVSDTEFNLSNIQVVSSSAYVLVIYHTAVESNGHCFPMMIDKLDDTKTNAIFTDLKLSLVRADNKLVNPPIIIFEDAPSDNFSWTEMTEDSIEARGIEFAVQTTSACNDLYNGAKLIRITPEGEAKFLFELSGFMNAQSGYALIEDGNLSKLYGEAMAGDFQLKINIMASIENSNLTNTVEDFLE